MNLVRSAGMSLNAFAAVRYLLSRPDDRARQFEGRFPALEIPVPIYQRESVPETEPVRPRALLTILLNRSSRGFPVLYTAEKKQDSSPEPGQTAGILQQAAVRFRDGNHRSGYNELERKDLLRRR